MSKRAASVPMTGARVIKLCDEKNIWLANGMSEIAKILDVRAFPFSWSVLGKDRIECVCACCNLTVKDTIAWHKRTLKCFSSLFQLYTYYGHNNKFKPERALVIESTDGERRGDNKRCIKVFGLAIIRHHINNAIAHKPLKWRARHEQQSLKFMIHKVMERI